MLFIGGVLHATGWLSGWRAHICIRTQKTRNNKRPTFTFTTLLFRRLIVSLPLFSSTAFVLRETFIHFLPFRKCFIAAVSRLDCAFSPVPLLTITFLTELAPVRLFCSLKLFGSILSWDLRVNISTPWCSLPCLVIQRTCRKQHFSPLLTVPHQNAGCQLLANDALLGLSCLSCWRSWSPREKIEMKFPEIQQANRLQADINTGTQSFGIFKTMFTISLTSEHHLDLCHDECQDFHFTPFWSTEWV